MISTFFTVTYINISNFFIDLNFSSLMAPQGRIYPQHGSKVTITVAFFFYLIVLLPKSDAGGSSESVEGSKVVIGSKPPACGNKCMSCRPCIATVVVPNHKRKGFNFKFNGVDDDSYYLLSWKCRCGDKLFQP
ncbi:hypothetical protein AAZX31_15G007700 [Glycine max]|uniref:Epidermal patterning factor-like protein n=2 Tax=Glycine subgen. Soja TaxID=1462606 RepID=I1MCF7_SOYBN|nr:EPIDERMAL PATTERNING FACTOR-like protein 8 [Glycine max]XP_028202075.1 EPIDERMAL PATTERNING FACTOR-like protein 8 [Glycine soja]KAG4955328.1 hypothetical protein JHK85_041708 [Glycine max]KAG5115196.1 hypothetical protein JHK84_041309 [Glycine max]KAH1207343.1 EPIDERMAL PATTERNING FACTOR-like protein 8 [Glycine max]KRH09730.1 hypothetical protein GLYMA_15G008000v4 [Glycine max]RZB62359.1 EPIDERMAL PATTERNING FACTOR-like protein 8 [Glycine soja]|eukprot:XP_006597120.1 EPIDERMAL PATTERNING FACTOR-like protein 8 [Glycine max]